MDNSNKPYFENLDALRFAAAFAVFVFHMGRDMLDFFQARAIFHNFSWITKFTDKGALGVNFFFVLSGFLITYLMLWEFENKGRFSYKKFLLRRTLRIWPLYFLIVCIGFWVFPWLLNDYDTAHNIIHYVLFLANFDEIQNGAFDTINFLTSPWSIAVEEQFYVFWGLLGLILLKRNILFVKWLRFVIIGLLLGALFFRFLNVEDSRALYYHTFSVMPDLLIGCLLALMWYENPAFFVLIKRLKHWQQGLIYVFGFLIVLSKNVIFSGALVVIERYVIAIFFAYIIVDQVVNRRRFPILGVHNMALRLGRISYGLYMYHLLVMYVLYKFWFSTLFFDSHEKWLYLVSAALYFWVSWLLVVMISKLSYSFFESPFLTLKKRLG